MDCANYGRTRFDIFAFGLSDASRRASKADFIKQAWSRSEAKRKLTELELDFVCGDDFVEVAERNSFGFWF